MSVISKGQDRKTDSRKYHLLRRMARAIEFGFLLVTLLAIFISDQIMSVILTVIMVSLVVARVALHLKLTASNP
jgi:hypothetical protein